jgi:mRNA interferase MazF
MVEYQWNIFWVRLDPVKGSEQAGIRPVLVVSAEEANKVLPTVTVLPVTSIKPGRKVYPIEAFLSAEDSGLPKDSVVLAHQIRCISKERLKNQCGSAASHELREHIRNAMKIYLDI